MAPDQPKLADDNYFRLIDGSKGTSSLVNAVGLVRVTNSLIPLGKSEVLRILRAYLSRRGHTRDDFVVDDFPSRAFWVAQLSFTLPDGTGFRGPGVGSFGTVVEEESEHWSRYPLCLWEGLPFDVSSGLMLAGVPESPLGYLDDIEEYGVLRTKPLCPAGNPLEIAERFLVSDAWKDIRWEGKELGRSWFISESWIRTMVRKQALEALADLYDPGEDIWAVQSHGGKYDWWKHRERVSALNPRWDAASQRYVSTK